MRISIPTRVYAEAMRTPRCDRSGPVAPVSPLLVARVSTSARSPLALSLPDGLRVVFTALAFLFTLPAFGQAQPTASQPAVLDRVVAVVNNQPILWSDIRNEIRFAVLDADTVSGTLTP